jgi:hypothetical protein
MLFSFFFQIQQLFFHLVVDPLLVVLETEAEFI